MQKLKIRTIKQQRVSTKQKLVILAKKKKSRKKGANNIKWIQEQSRNLKIIKSTMNNFMSINANLHKK